MEQFITIFTSSIFSLPSSTPILITSVNIQTALFISNNFLDNSTFPFFLHSSSSPLQPLNYLTHPITHFTASCCSSDSHRLATCTEWRKENEGLKGNAHLETSMPPTMQRVGKFQISGLRSSFF